jgi:arylsulfatase A-like enzyme
MRRRTFLKGLSALAAASALRGLPSAAGERRSSRRPNLVYVFADQLRADALGCYSSFVAHSSSFSKAALTPNLDRFAATSLNFSNAVSVMPVCAAYRASLLTGKYPSSHGMVINEVCMNPNHRTIAHVLGDAGYRTAYIGKWHLLDTYTRAAQKGPERLGFTTWAGYNFNHDSFREYYYTDAPDGGMMRVSLEGKHGPTEITTLATKFIEESARGDAPFAMFLSWNPPHDPWTRTNVLAENYEKFKNARFGLPENFKQEPDPYMDRYPELAFTGGQWRKDFLERGLDECLRCYHAMVNNLDELFARILACLDRLGIADNTIVVFTSDHGEMFASQGRMFKLTFYDESCRIPFLVRYPGKVKPGNSDVCLNTPDIMPTLLGLMGLGTQIPFEVEGQDLSFACFGERGVEPEAAFMQGLGHTHLWRDGFEWRAVRDKRFTYARYLRDGKEVLLDRKSDPYMKNNLAGDPAYAAQVARLRNLMARKMGGLKDDFQSCTWYRDNWMYKNYSVKAAAPGTFGPLPPIEPLRT